MDAPMEDDFSILVRGVSLNREEVSHSQLASLPPGSILHLPYDEAVQQIEHDLLRACTAAEGYELIEACELPADLVDVCIQVSQPDCRDDTWDAVMYKRISSSWRYRRSELIWLDDKLEQVSRVAELLGSPLHLPVLAYAAAGNAEQEKALQMAVIERADKGEAIVLKPRHGANSCFVSLWPQPQNVDHSQLLQSLAEALYAEDRSLEEGMLAAFPGAPRGDSAAHVLHLSSEDGGCWASRSRRPDGAEGPGSLRLCRRRHPEHSPGPALGSQQRSYPNVEVPGFNCAWSGPLQDS